MASNHEIKDYETFTAFETFSFLPPLTNDELIDQISYLIAQGWTAAIEHEHPAKSASYYWPMWKLPFFGETDVDVITGELEACHRAYPSHHVRLIGYDSYLQSQGTSFVVYRGRG